MQQTHNPTPPQPANHIQYKFLAGNLALDFCNTVAGERGKIAREYLKEPSQFIEWARQASLLNEAEAEKYLQRANQNPDKAREVLARAVRLREAVFRLVTSCRCGDTPNDEDLRLLNDELSRAPHQLRLSPSQEECTAGSPSCAFRWEWLVGDDLDQPLGTIAHAAATLLTQSEELARTRICLGDNCGWLFVDRSKNHSRCWCDMRDCGNRAKIRRHRQKQRRC